MSGQWRYWWMVWVGLSSLAMAEIVPVWNLEGETMGTLWHVTLVKPEGEILPSEVQKEIEETLREIDTRMSTWKEYSELSRINATEKIDEEILLSSELALVLRAALEVAQKSGGAYDITVGPLVNLWKFGPDSEKVTEERLPNDKEIQNAQKNVGYAALRLAVDEDGTGKLKREKPGLYIDLSSIAKGYGVDRVAEVLEKFGITSYMVEVGGEVRTSGKNVQNQPWRIGIETPVPGISSLYGVVELEDASLATSGDYRNFRQEGKKRLSHILDPRTGRPVEHSLVSVSVQADNCMLADAWATALMVLGPEEGQNLAKKENISALFLIQKGNQIENVAVHFPWKSFQKEKTSDYALWMQWLLPVLFFLFFFVAVGMSQLLGRRKMMCSCKAAKVMEKERNRLIQIQKMSDDEKVHFK
ncbi:MAG: FAD:protein FMN transferase [Planctomycetia bacterium]|nr:FAD:protein FMN transferase [Planctomycetia bacterium]